jgi:hypothetical protein
MTTGSLDGLGPFVIELVAQVDDEQRGGARRRRGRGARLRRGGGDPGSVKVEGDPRPGRAGGRRSSRKTAAIMRATRPRHGRVTAGGVWGQPLAAGRSGM